MRLSSSKPSTLRAANPWLLWCAVPLLAAAANASAQAPGAGILFAPGTQIVVAPQPAAAGTQQSSYNGLGIAVDGVGDVYLADPFNGSGVVVEFPHNGGAPITLGTDLSRPFGVAVDDAGDLFIADTFNRRIVELPAGGGAQTTIATGIIFPSGVAVDHKGDVYIADSSTGRVSVVPAGGGPRTTVGSGFTEPSGVAVDSAGNVYVADASQTSIIKVPADGGPQTTLGTGLQQPGGVAIDTLGNLYVADTFNNRIVVIPPSGPQFVLGVGLSEPNGVAVDSSSNVYIADTNNGRVVEVDRSTAPPIVFPNTLVGATASITLTLQSSGTLPLDFSSISLTTATGGNFVLDPSSTCAQSTPLPTGETCTLVLDFVPQAGGSSAASLVLNDNSAGASGHTQTIPITGTSTDPVARFDAAGPNTVVYGDPSEVFTTTAFDAVGNVDTSLNGPYPLMVSGALNTTAQINFVNGVANTLLPVLDSGIYVFTLTDGAAQATFTLTITPSLVFIASTPPVLGYGQPGAIPVALAGQYVGHGAAPVRGLLSYSIDGSAQTPISETTGSASLPVPSTLAVGTHTLVVSYPGDLDYQPATKTFSFTVAQVSIALASSAPTVDLGAPVTFTAALSSVPATAIVGTVSFYDGTTLIGTAALAQGTASFTTSSLSAGTHTIVAVYGGGPNYLATASAQLVETIIPPDFAISPNPPALTIQQGQSGVVAYTFAPVGGYTGSVAFTCKGLPDWASCSFAPGTLVADGSNTANTTTMTIITLGPHHSSVAANAFPAPPALRGGPRGPARTAAASLAFLAPMLLLGVMVYNRKRPRLVSLLCAAFLLAASGALSGCLIAGPSVPVGTYSVIVTAAASTGTTPLSRTSTLTLTVTP